MRAAFKEWAAICRAFAAGRQDVILRKGGIVESGGEFRPDHASFLLLPTFLHQSPESLIPAAHDLLADIDADRPPDGSVVFHHVVRVLEARRVLRFDDLAAYRGRHVWSDAVVAERFHRWKDELHVLAVTVTPLAAPIAVPWHESYGGCRSWVELQEDVPVGPPTSLS
ncbi:MAG: DUF1802 family protein [Planctomycetaceae bacterium]